MRKLWQKQNELSTAQPRNLGRFLLLRTGSGPLDGNQVRLPLSNAFFAKWD